MREKAESRHLVVLQTCLPDYRLPFFEQLVAAIPGTKLICGQDYFTASLALCIEPAPWRVYIKNRFSFSRSLLWQVGVGDLTSDAEVVIAEFNPRVLSTWVLLLRRRLAGKRTLLWGHLWGQHGPVWLSRNLRLFMLWLSDGMVSYTHEQAREFSRLLPQYSVWTAANSCVTSAQCGATEAVSTANSIAYVGRLIRAKKPGLLLEAFAQAVDRLPRGTKLILAGSGPDSDNLKQRVNALSLGDRVEMPGHVAGPRELKEIYDRSVVAVSPGYVGLSAIQCMAFGVPMLISRTEPHSPEIEACIEGKTCEFFETDAVENLADMLVTFFRPDSPWHLARAGIAEFISRNYTIEKMVGAFISAAKIHELAHDSRPQLALVWAQYGPYHMARLAAFQSAYRGCNILGIEIANLTSTYQWQRSDDADGNIITLLPGGLAEEASIVDIYQAALREFRRRHIDVVFVTSYWPASSLAIILAARNTGARLVMMNESHQLTAKARGILAYIKRRLILSFDAALVGGSPHREYFAKMGLKPEKILLGYDAIDNEYFASKAAWVRANRAEIIAKHGLPEKFFLSVGRMVWKKNLETLVDAYKATKSSLGLGCPRLVFVGSGKLERSLRERCLGHGLSVWQAGANAPDARPGDADVFFYGFKQAEELPDFYALASAFILPSREEEWGLVVNEAMACSLPVLVSRVCGCAQDLVVNGKNGYLFDPFDVSALAGHLSKIARQPELTSAMGTVSRDIIDNWGCDRFARAANEAAEIALK